MKTNMTWVGSDKTFIDELDVTRVQNVTVGRFGGNSQAGSYKNEDGCLVWANEVENWEFTMVLDGHKTAQSVELVLNHFEKNEDEIKSVLSESASVALKKLDYLILDIFQDPDFMDSCRKTTGETACLIVVRKEKYLWWFSIGDCILHLFHPELIVLGERQLVQRSFYEWVGEVNTFELPVPCYRSGKKEMRKGLNQIFMTTDGLTECPGVPYEDAGEVQKVLSDNGVEKGVRFLLEEIRRNSVRDSTTIIAWSVDIEETASMPSDL
ncbi:protein phosphatase 2C domain-containing protein [Fictibacillus norfolkensis]|uniref:Protein phosphatase 2C domain-containing protein n=1 Tax=Fictibacillus norfolkensis TaxID=2762233 RepID=A0ABR8SKG2_9BACL|nr:protein phosphatase 2C domain-containing protein [Fictibacillus norfolkensis]MBD7963965.1 protein phosphatase 2C domain-containing protein [Fictibacillus norfolkensis]